MKTPGGLTVGNGLVRKAGRLVSRKVSAQSKSKFNRNNKLQDRAKMVKAAFAAVKRARRGNQKIKSAAVIRSPEDAARNPSKYLV